VPEKEAAITCSGRSHFPSSCYHDG